MSESDRLTLDDLRPLTFFQNKIPGEPHISTLHRWCSVGVRGVRLKVWYVNGQRMTTEAELIRFFEILGGLPEKGENDRL